MTEPAFEYVATERGPHLIGGSDFGNPVRVLMRSATHALIVGYGIHLLVRADGTNGRLDCLCRDSKPKSFPEITVAKIDQTFGKGAADHALAAVFKRGQGTVLVDGGGDPLPEAQSILRERAAAQFSAITPTRSFHHSFDLLCCKQCGEQLKPFTTIHHLARKPTEDHPSTLEDCRRLTNHPITAVFGFSANSPRDWWRFISWFETWDGERYRDPDFCNDRCAAHYGRRAARMLAALPGDNSTVDRERMVHESVNHYEEEERFLTTSDGTKIRY